MINRKITFLTLTCLFLSTFFCLAEEKEGRKVILSNKTFWRFCTMRETGEVVDESGNIVHGSVGHDFDSWTDFPAWFGDHPDQPTLTRDRWKIRKIPEDEVIRLPSGIPSDWMHAEFNDSDWLRSRGPMLGHHFSTDQGWKLIQMRGTFKVEDPARAKDLKLSLKFRGGAVVYLNGKEIMRKHMPEGPVTISTPANPYPEEADFMDDGFLVPFSTYDSSKRARANLPKDVRDRIALRAREISEAPIPASELRKGVNVLAVSLHRAPTPAKRYMTVKKGKTSIHKSLWWQRLGLKSIALKSSHDSAVVPNIDPKPGLGFKHWNQSIVQDVKVSDYPDPFDSPNPIQIAATRNGAFSGQIVVGDDKPIKSLQVDVSDLSGPGGSIPEEAIQVRYGRPDGHNGSFDSLEEDAPSEVPVSGKYNRSVQPVWVTVRTPSDIPSGLYNGEVTIRAEGIEPRKAKLQIRVSGWNMPQAKTFTSRLDIIQSPESVAMAYDVPLWSDEHFALLDKSFSLLGDLGSDTIYITCIRRTHFGNEHAMLRWVRDENFELKPDFTIVERYLDTAIKHMGRIPGIILYCWEPPYSQGHAGGSGQAGKIHDKPILYSLYDPETGEYASARGPAWGTAEARVFWKKVSDGMQAILEKRGLRDSMMFGLAGDHRPTKQAMDDISHGVKDARWAIHSHYRCESWQGYPMGLFNALWGVGCDPTDPDRGYGLGWTNPRWMSYYPRNNLKVRSTITKYRCMIEAWIGAYSSKWPAVATGEGIRGLGRIGADFWKVLGRRRSDTLAGRYPESAWGQLSLNFGVPRILGAGKNGPVATVRSEAFRESAQEIEARIYLEKAWLDPRAPQIIGEELVSDIRRLLDTRIRILNITASQGDAAAAWFISSGWKERNQSLFDLADRVQKKYGNKEPDPALERKNKEEEAE